ncbi:hypothetical protein ACIRSS_11505 [Amycolatopsis sp. NPDC101161]|uniref:hypothetical protein n=1 Tax=Amycolatopsis sp. NPDC101161 TaxID=3363940 RepID=UPI0038286895
MTSAVGDRLRDFLRDLRTTTTWTIVADDACWRLAGSTWRATVVVEPRWLGLEFEARDPVTGKRVTYDIDTDLYDISRDEQRAFADEIERDIIEFLGNLRGEVLLRGTDGAKLVLVFPLDGSYVRVVRGRFWTSASTHAGVSTDGFVPVR